MHAQFFISFNACSGYWEIPFDDKELYKLPMLNSPWYLSCSWNLLVGDGQTLWRGSCADYSDAAEVETSTGQKQGSRIEERQKESETSSSWSKLCWTCVFSRWLETRVWYWVEPISEKPLTDKEGVARNRNCQLTRHAHWTQNHLQVPNSQLAQ